jgi:hypothetical protein
LEVSIMTADQVSKKQFHRGVSSRWRQSAKPGKWVTLNLSGVR